MDEENLSAAIDFECDRLADEVIVEWDERGLDR